METIRRLDRRLETIVEVFSRTRKLDSSLVVVTSDHGQSFGERGHVFHEYDSGDSVLRVPLLVRFPTGERAGVESDSWTSLVDIAPTVRETCALRRAEAVDGFSLKNLAECARSTPVLAVSDGHTSFRSKGSNGRPGLTATDPLTVVGYLNNLRAAVSSPDWIPLFHSVDGETTRRSTPGLEKSYHSGTPQVELDELVSCVTTAARLLVPASDPSARLTSWGY